MNKFNYTITWRAKQFVGSVLRLSYSSAVGQLVMLAATPILTRLYSPKDFGLLAVFSAGMGVVLVISSLRYELAIPLPRSNRNAFQLLSLSLTINLIFAGITAVGVMLFRHNIAGWMEAPQLGDLLWILPIAIIAAGSYKSLNYWVVRNQDFNRIGKTKIMQGVANVIAQIIGGLSGLGALGLITGQVVGQSVGVSSLAKGLEVRTLLHQGRGSCLRSFALMKRYKLFPKYDVPASGVNAVSVQLPNFLLAALFNPAIAGYYYLSERLLGVPLSMVGQAVAQVLYGQARKNIQEGTLVVTVRRIALILSCIVFFPAILIHFWAEPAFVLIFGEVWRQAGIYTSWLIIGLAAQFVYSPLSMVLMATEGQLVNLAIHSIILIMKLIALFIGYSTENALLGIQALSVALFIGYCTGILLLIRRTTLIERGNL